MANDPRIRRAISSIDRPADNEVHPSVRQHDGAASDALLRIYIAKRIDGQRAYYQERIKEFEANAGLMTTIGALIMAFSAALSAAGAGFQSAEIALATAILPALATLVASFRSLYQWERQAGLYRDATLGLDEAKLQMPDSDVYNPRSASVLLPLIVRTTEEVFEAEINQWGQIAMQKDSEEQQDEFNQALLSLSDDEKLNGGSVADFDDGGVG